MAGNEMNCDSRNQPHDFVQVGETVATTVVRVFCRKCGKVVTL